MADPNALKPAVTNRQFGVAAAAAVALPVLGAMFQTFDGMARGLFLWSLHGDALSLEKQLGPVTAATVATAALIGGQFLWAILWAFNWRRLGAVGSVLALLVASDFMSTTIVLKAAGAHASPAPGSHHITPKPKPEPRHHITPKPKPSHHAPKPITHNPTQARPTHHKSSQSGSSQVKTTGTLPIKSVVPAVTTPAIRHSEAESNPGGRAKTPVVKRTDVESSSAYKRFTSSPAQPSGEQQTQSASSKSRASTSASGASGSGSATSSAEFSVSRSGTTHVAAATGATSSASVTTTSDATATTTTATGTGSSSPGTAATAGQSVSSISAKSGASASAGTAGTAGSSGTSGESSPQGSGVTTPSATINNGPDGSGVTTPSATINNGPGGSTITTADGTSISDADGCTKITGPTGTITSGNCQGSP